MVFKCVTRVLLSVSTLAGLGLYALTGAAWLDVTLWAIALGQLPMAVVHPWEISGRPTPGRLSGFAKFVHETGRLGFEGRFEELEEAREKYDDVEEHFPYLRTTTGPTGTA